MNTGERPTLAKGLMLLPALIVLGLFFTSVILLFSNGTVVTIGPSTNVKLEKFAQEKFDAGDQPFRDWQEEPSLSDMRLSLDFGSLIVGTKKLNKDSSFAIDSPRLRDALDGHRCIHQPREYRVAADVHSRVLESDNIR